MTETLRITAAEPVLHGALKLSWNDGHVGLVDLRGMMRSGEIIAALRDPASFQQARISEHGPSIYWSEEGDEAVDFGCDRLRELAAHTDVIPAKAGIQF